LRRQRPELRELQGDNERRRLLLPRRLRVAGRQQLRCGEAIHRPAGESAREMGRQKAVAKEVEKLNQTRNLIICWLTYESN